LMSIDIDFVEVWLAPPREVGCLDNREGD
jgi:hypothetical protein